MTVGFYSPLPPARTGVADYAAALLAELSKSVTVLVDAPQAGVSLYHLGNNQLHREIYQRALTTPGVVVLHDAVLQHFFLGSLTQSAYVDEFIYNYGAWSRDLAELLWSARAGSATDERYFSHPMLRRIAETSLAVVVHNPAAAAMVRMHAPHARVVEISHLFVPRAPEPAAFTEQLRASLLPRPGAFLFGIFGYLRESKRLLPILRAYEQVRTQANMALLIAGEFASSDLARAIAPDLAAPGIIRIPYLPDQDWWRHASAVDACINLRHPAAGETSGIGVRLMGIGKPVLVSDVPENANLPASACVRIETGPAETEMLADVMLWLARHPEDAAVIGQKARQHVQQHHAVERIAIEYRKILESCYHQR